MKSVKIKYCLIITLALVIALTMGAFFAILNAGADRAVSVGGSNVFTVVGDAEIWAHRTENQNAEGDDPYYYTMFAFEKDADAVNYRHNLAYKWFYDKNDNDDYLPDSPRKGYNGNWLIRGEDTGITYDPAVTPTVDEDGFWVIGDTKTKYKEKADPLSPEMGQGYFHMEIGFEEVNFDKFVITFESQQYSMTKDKKTVNYVIFLPVSYGEAGNVSQDSLYCVITSDKDVAESEAKDIRVNSPEYEFAADHIVIALSGGENGNYDVSVCNAQDEGISARTLKGVFENVGSTYARNVSSNTDPVVPLSFKADMPVKEEDDLSVTRARMTLYELNGQSFLLNRDSDGFTNSFTPINEVDDGEGKKHYTGGQVNDTTPPVLCLDSELRHINEGSELNSYTAIDVLTQYTNTEMYYFILTKEQQAAENFDADDCSAENLFKTVKSDDDQYIIPHANHYLPAEADYAGKNFGEDYIPCAAIKIYLKLTDTTSSGGQSTIVMLDWYVDEQYKLTINQNDYIAVSTDKTGAHYTRDVIGADGSKSVSKEDWENSVAEYQTKVNEAAKDLRAGTDDFYLPSLEGLIADNSTAYSDMNFSIYYMVNGTKSSATGKNANELSLDLNSAGNYMFTVYAQDAASNGMWYLKDSGEGLEKVEFSASDIWDIYDDEELRDKLPWFTFKAGISEITIEEPEEQETAYVGESYTAGTFEIKGVSTKVVYTLYRFNSELYSADHNGEVLSYENFMEIKGELFDGEGRKYFTNIVAASDLEEGSEEYDRFSAYNWNASSRSFTPQDGNAFYVIKCEVTSTQFPAMTPVKAYMGIAASVTPDPIKGEDTWVQDNMISIILFAIAGAAFIGIILLLVIKPKEKGDIDVQFEQETAAKAEKPKSKRK